MARIKIISVILCLIFIFCGWALTYTQKKTSDITCLLEQVISEIQSNHYEAAAHTALLAQSEWEHVGSIILTFVNSRDVDTVDENLIQLNVSIQQQNKMQALTLIEQINFHLEHIYQSELPLLKNVL